MNLLTFIAVERYAFIMQSTSLRSLVRGLKRSIIIPAFAGMATLCLSMVVMAEDDNKKAEAVAANMHYATEILPLIEKYCMDCHDSVVTKGDLDLERFDSRQKVITSMALWTRMARRINENSMPPKDEIRPNAEEKKKILDWIKVAEGDNGHCNQLASQESANWYPGYVMSRRLNRQEYENTLSDLLGLELYVADNFPEDGSGGEGFNTHGNSLFLSAIQMEKYLSTADDAIETALLNYFTGEKVVSSIFKRKEYTSERKIFERLIPVKPSRDYEARDAASDVVNAFAQRAWRRPLEENELDRVLALFDKSYERGDGYKKSVKLAFKAVLISPNFIFLAEPEPDAIGDYPLGGYPLASRLSYFLWASMPDDELFELAEAGTLNDPVVLKGQIKRMLKDPRAQALGKTFASQWLGITQLGEARIPDAERFTEFNEGLLLAMKAEVAMFFNRIIQEDRSLLDLLDSDYTYVNESLADIYGIEGIAGEEMRLVQLPEDSMRGGLLGMSAILTNTSHSLRTSPVLRGKWVLDELLGERVAPPPPDVPAFDEEKIDTGEMSMRTQLELHRKNPECASCHDRMDPIGFGLENFDAIGRWRNEHKGNPVDAKGTLTNGKQFEGPAELKTVLLDRKDGVAKNLTRKMLGYALGRNLTRQDNCVIQDSMEALKANEYRPSGLIEEIVLSYPFRHRYSNGKLEETD